MVQFHYGFTLFEIIFLHKSNDTKTTKLIPFRDFCPRGRLYQSHKNTMQMMQQFRVCIHLCLIYLLIKASMRSEFSFNIYHPFQTCIQSSWRFLHCSKSLCRLIDTVLFFILQSMMLHGNLQTSVKQVLQFLFLFINLFCSKLRGIIILFKFFTTCKFCFILVPTKLKYYIYQAENRIGRILYMNILNTRTVWLYNPVCVLFYTWKVKFPAKSLQKQQK